MDNHSTGHASSDCELSVSRRRLPPEENYNSLRVSADIVWMDIDNTLYTSNAKISELMTERIHAYFVSDIGLSEHEASALHHDYYTRYGLALRGLIKHHGVDGLDFDRKCDLSLPLEDMLKPDPKIRRLLEDIDRSKARVWALTNAYYTHASRVLRILGLDDQIESIVFCDYAVTNFSCKPEPAYYHEALHKAGVSDARKCLFVDDNLQNVRIAKQLGWGSCVYYRERTTIDGKLKDPVTHIEGVDATIENLEELRYVWRHIFRP